MGKSTSQHGAYPLLFLEKQQELRRLLRPAAKQGGRTFGQPMSPQVLHIVVVYNGMGGCRNC